MCLRGVLEQPQPVPGGDLLQRPHAGRVPVEVHGHDADRAFRDRRLDRAGSRQKVSGSMSANTGVAPVRATELAVAAKVNEGTMTPSPAPTPQDSNPRCSPDVPELTATHALAEVRRELLLEGLHLGALGEHPGADHPGHCGDLVVTDDRLGRGMKSVMGLPPSECRRAPCMPPPVSGQIQRPSPVSVNGTPARPTHPIRRAGTPATSKVRNVLDDDRSSGLG